MVTSLGRVLHHPEMELTLFALHTLWILTPDLTVQPGGEYTDDPCFLVDRTFCCVAAWALGLGFCMAALWVFTLSSISVAVTCITEVPEAKKIRFQNSDQSA